MVFSLVLKMYLAWSKVMIMEGSVSDETEERTEEDQFMSEVVMGFLRERKRRRRGIPETLGRSRPILRILATLS